MEDRTFLTNNHPTNGISDIFREFIEALVEEVVINGEPFDAQKKWLRKRSEAEGLNYETIESNLTDLFEAVKELEGHESKSGERLIGFLAKECYLSEAFVNKLIDNAAVVRTQKEAERKDQEERERKAREEAERKAREERDRIAKEKAQLQKKLDAERKAREETERKAREEAERKAREKTFQQVKDILVDKLDVDEASITEFTSFKDLYIYIDSLDQVELIMEFERVFGFEVTEKMINSIYTVGDVVAKIVDKKQKRTF